MTLNDLFASIKNYFKTALDWPSSDQSFFDTEISVLFSVLITFIAFTVITSLTSSFILKFIYDPPGSVKSENAAEVKFKIDEFCYQASIFIVIFGWLIYSV